LSGHRDPVGRRIAAAELWRGLRPLRHSSALARPALHLLIRGFVPEVRGLVRAFVASCTFRDFVSYVSWFRDFVPYVSWFRGFVGSNCFWCFVPWFRALVSCLPVEIGLALVVERHRRRLCALAAKEHHRML